MNISKSIKLIGAGVVLIGLVGCAAPGSGMSRPDNLTLIDSASVPKENWSDALVMMNDQMGIAGMHDATPGAAMGSGGSFVNQVAARNQNGFEMGIMTGSLAIGGLFSLLESDGSNRMIGQPQVAYWVPADAVSSSEEAAEWARQNWLNIRKEVLSGTRRVPEESDSARYPMGHPSQFPTLRDANMRNYRPFVAEPKVQTVGNDTSEYYGPIFISTRYYLQADRSALGLDSVGDVLKLYGDSLPDTAMLYYQGIPFLKGYEPGFIIHQGQVSYFISKGL